MSIATERRQFYDSEILALPPAAVILGSAVTLRWVWPTVCLRKGAYPRRASALPRRILGRPGASRPTDCALCRHSIRLLPLKRLKLCEPLPEALAASRRQFVHPRFWAHRLGKLGQVLMVGKIDDLADAAHVGEQAERLLGVDSPDSNDVGGIP